MQRHKRAKATKRGATPWCKGVNSSVAEASPNASDQERSCNGNEQVTSTTKTIQCKDEIEANSKQKSDSEEQTAEAKEVVQTTSNLQGQGWIQIQ